VLVVQQPVEAVDRGNEVVRGVVVVVEVDFDLAVTIGTERLDLVQMLLDILLFGIEEAVLRYASVGVAVARGEGTVVRAPAVDATALRVHVHTAPVRFEVVDETEHDVDRARHLRDLGPGEVSPQPVLHVARTDRYRHRGGEGEQDQDDQGKDDHAAAPAGTRVSSCSALLRHCRSLAM
jgi:hypothetical protein